jgi:hypothetical protein
MTINIMFLLRLNPLVGDLFNENIKQALVSKTKYGLGSWPNNAYDFGGRNILGKVNGSTILASAEGLRKQMEAQPVLLTGFRDFPTIPAPHLGRRAVRGVSLKGAASGLTARPMSRRITIHNGMAVFIAVITLFHMNHSG